MPGPRLTAEPRWPAERPGNVWARESRHYPSMANMQAALGGIGSALGVANENYQKAEKSVMRRWA